MSADSLVSFNVSTSEAELFPRDGLLFPFQFCNLRVRMANFEADARRIVDAYFRLNLDR